MMSISSEKVGKKSQGMPDLDILAVFTNPFVHKSFKAILCILF